MAARPKTPEVTAGESTEKTVIPEALPETPGVTPGESTKEENTEATATPAAMLSVTARAGSFRRCGYRFGAEPVVIAVAELPPEHVAALQAEPQLLVAMLPVEA